MKGELANESLQGERRKRDKAWRDQLDRDARQLMSMPEGRRFLLNFIEAPDACNAFGLSFAGDDRLTAFREGRRSVGIELASDLQRVSPELWVKALADEYERRIQEKHQAELAKDKHEEPDDE